MYIIRIKNSSTAELLMKSWEPSTLKVYSCSYTRFRNFCISNSLNPANITLVVFMDYLKHLFKNRPPLAFSTINGHRSMLNKLLLLGNQIDIVNDPFITRILTGIHKLSPSFANYQEIWDVNQVFKHLSTIKVIPKYTYTALLNKKLVLCIMFGLARSSDLVKWCFVNHIIFILKGRRKSDSDDSVFIRNDGKPLDVKEINIIVLSQALELILANDDDVYATERTDVSDAEVKEKEQKSQRLTLFKLKPLIFLKNAATDVIFMNIFTIHYS
ncbi:hypothetical protein ACTFIR_009773 [Dictyostelium discoideum]